jgi:hypothetical protein
MCAPSAPAPPDYAAAAKQQGQDNLAAARISTAINRPNEITPYGTRTWTNGAQTGNAPTTPGVSASGTGATLGGYNLPFGGSAYGLGGGTNANTPAIGAQDQWTSEIKLAPEQQALFDAQNRISRSMAGTAEQNLDRVAQSQAQPWDTSSLPNVPTNGVQNAPRQDFLQRNIDTSNVNPVSSDQFSTYRDNAYNDLMSRQNQQFNQQDESLQQRLANQGLTPGSEAYNRAYQPLNQSRVDASNQADLASHQLQNQYFNEALASNQNQFGQNAAQGAFGNAASGQQFNQFLQGQQANNQAAAQRFAQGLQGRQQGIQEQAYARSQPLNELNALRTGSQVTSPQFQAFNNNQQVTPAPTFAGAQALGQAQQQNYANQVAGSNNFMSGLFGLGAAGLTGGYF